MTDERSNGGEGHTGDDQGEDEEGAVEAGTRAQERDPEIGPGTRPGDDVDADDSTATPGGRP